MDEGSFIARVRGGLEGRRSPPEPEIPVESLHMRSDAAGMVDRFVRELEEVGGVVDRVRSLDEARDRIRRLVAERAIERIVRANTALEKELGIDGALVDSGVEVTVCDTRLHISPEQIREREFAADAGLGFADYGVAETGTLAVLARPGQGRAVSLLPSLHIALLRASNIVSDLSVLFDRVSREREELPSALTFITGPSRTADIELVLTVGVHGPKGLHLLLLE